MNHALHPTLKLVRFLHPALLAMFRLAFCALMAGCLTPSSATAALAGPEAFGYRNMAPATNRQPMIVVVVDFDDTTNRTSVAATASWIFPDTPTNRSVNGIFAEMSSGRFAFTNAGIVAIVEPATNRYEAMKQLVTTNFSDGLYLSNLYAHAVQANPAPFFARDVAPHDGQLSRAEVVLLFVFTDGLGGAGRGMIGGSLPFGPGWSGEGVYASPPGDIHTLCHELSHALGATDIYSIWGGHEQDMNPNLSLMAASSYAHLDAWHKMQFGWYEPRIFSLRTDGAATLYPAQRRKTNAPIILYDETRGTDEYYLLEYRTPECAAVPNTHYVHDNVHDSGLLIWHVRQNASHGLQDYHDVTYPQAQGDWWQCKHCRALYLPNMVMPCPSTNGTHVRYGDTDIHFLVDNVPSDPGEHGWSHCTKCSCLFFAPNLSESDCVAGGQHAAHSGHSYSLPKNVPGPLGHNNWGRCLKCQCLFTAYRQDVSVCPDDNGNHSAGTDRYTLIANDHRTLMSRGAPSLLYGTSSLWRSGRTTPKLNWYNGTTNLLRISVDPFEAGDNFINVSWTTWDPTPLVISHPTNLVEGFNNVTVSVSDGTNGVAGATVKIRGTSGTWEALTSAGGTATLPLALGGTQTLSVTVTKDRYITATGTISVGTGYLAFDPISSPKLHGVPFPVTLRARSTVGVVSNFTGTATLEAFRRGQPGSVLLTEFILGRSGSYWRGLQVQNVSTQSINTAGWRVAIGDNPTNINAVNATVKTLPSTMASLAFLGWTDIAANPWGSIIGWAQNQPGWAMILNSNNQVVDFAAWGWDSHDIETMAPVVNGQPISAASAWAGDGFPIPTSNQDLYRQGYEDRNAADDFQTGMINVVIANPHLTLPFGSLDISLSLTPEVTGHFTNGVWSGSVTLLDVGDEVALLAVAGPRQGESGSFDVEPTVLHHYRFAPITSPKIWNAPFSVTITAQDASSNTILSFNGSAEIRGFQGVPAPPVLITECNLGEPDIVEVQNVSTTSRNTTGWRLIVGDNPTNINRVNPVARPLPTSLAPKQVYWAKDDAAATNYWGGALNWSNSAPGWVMLLDANTNIVDFAAWGWSAEDIANMSPSYGRTRLPVVSQWAGSGVAFVKRGLPGSLQRRGNVDYNRATDFVWNTFTSYGYQNSALTTPLAGAFAPIAILPETTGDFTNGVWTGSVTVREDATNVFLQVLDGTGRSGESTLFEARYLGQLTVTVPATATEGDGVLTGQGMIQFPGIAKGGTTVYLTSSVTTEITVPASVTLLSAQSSIAFNLTVVDDPLIDLGRSVTIQASAAGYSNDAASMVVLDNEAFTMRLYAPANVAEGDGVRTNACRLALGANLAEPAVFHLTSSLPARIQVPATVTVPAGTNQFYCDLTVVDNALVDGTQTVTVTLSTDGMANTSDSVQVADNDPHHFEFDGISSPQAVLNPFPVTIRAVNAAGTTLPAFQGEAAITATNASGLLAMDPIWPVPFSNGVWSGLVTLFQVGNAIKLHAQSGEAVGDSDRFDAPSGTFHHFAWETLPAAAHDGAWLPVCITARDSNNLLVTDFTGTAKLLAARHAPGNRLRLLTLVTKHTDLSGDYTNTMNALRRHFTDFDETPLDPATTEDLENALSKNDVLLVPAQDQAPAGTLPMLGAEWAKALQNFVTNGGIVVVCSGHNEEHTLLAEANLLRLERASYGWDQKWLSRWTADPINAGVSPVFESQHVGAYYEGGDKLLVLTSEEGFAVVISANYGAGRVVMIGTDFTTIGSELDRVLANAVRLGLKRVSDPLPLTPIITPPFTGGAWTGIVAVAGQGLDVMLAATDAASLTNYSSPFDASPLRLASSGGAAPGDLLLRWDSAGVTRYTLEGSPTLLPGSFMPLLTNLLATPPFNACTGRVDSAERVFYRIRVETP